MVGTRVLQQVQDELPASMLWRQAQRVQGVSQPWPGAVPCASAVSLAQPTALAMHNTAAAAVVPSRTGAWSVLTLDQDVPRVVVRRPAPAAVLDAAWQDDTLLLAGAGGAVLQYRLTPDEVCGDGNTSTSSSVDVTHRYVHADIVDLAPSLAGPGALAPSADVRCVDVSLPQRMHFATAENTRVHVWDQSQGEGPIATIDAALQRAEAIHWHPGNADTLAIGTHGGSVKLADARSASVTQHAGDGGTGHASRVACVQWSPLVPHWLASAGADAVVRVWDTRRLLHPAMELVGARNAVSSLAWSMWNAELLLSGDWSHRVVLWSVNLPPHHVVASYGAMHDAVVGAAFAPAMPYRALAISADAQAVALPVSLDLTAGLVPHHMKEAEERRVEALVYARDLAAAVPKANAIASMYIQHGRLLDAAAVLALCSPSSITDDDSADVPPTPAPASHMLSPPLYREDGARALAMGRFDAEVQAYAAALPPNIVSLLQPSVRDADQQERAGIMLLLAVQQAVASSDGAALWQYETELRSLFARSAGQGLPPATLHAALTLALQTDWLRGMALAIDWLAEVAGAHSSATPPALLPIVQALLSPTVYQPSATASAGEQTVLNTMLRTVLRPPAAALAALRLLLAVHQAWWSELGRAAAVIACLPSPPPLLLSRSPVVISTSVVRIVLHALCEQGRFHAALATLLDYVDTLPGSAFAEALCSEELPHIASAMDTAMADAAASATSAATSTSTVPDDDAATQRVADLILELSAVLHDIRRVPSLPADVQRVLSAQLEPVCEALRRSLPRGLRGRDAQRKERSAAHLRQFLQRMQQQVGDEHIDDDKRRHLAELVFDAVYAVQAALK